MMVVYLWIGSNKVVNNDGIQEKTTKSGKIILAAGLHPIKVAFFEHSNGEMLQVSYAGPGVSKKLIPNNVLFQGDGSNARTGNVAQKGESQPSKEISIEQPASWVALHAYPNPVRDKLNLDLTGDEGEVISISLIDQLAE